MDGWLGGWMMMFGLVYGDGWAAGYIILWTDGLMDKCMGILMARSIGDSGFSGVCQALCGPKIGIHTVDHVSPCLFGNSGFIQTFTGS